jgi:hypothetical protein
MPFPTDDIFLGPASFGRRRGTEGFIWHTTEGADASRGSALATARWQLTNPGSYSWIIYDGGLLLTVPYLEASGGVNPASTSWAPERYPFLKANLSLSAYADPNAFLINVAFSGKTALFRDKGIPANMIETAQRLVEWVEAQDWSARKLVHSGHLHWQRNRSDPSEKVLALITGEDPIMSRPWLPRTVEWDTVPGGEFFVGTERKVFTASVPVTTFAEQFELIDGKPTSPPDRLLMAAYPDSTKGPEILTFPRTSLIRPRNVRDGLPVSGYTADDLKEAQMFARQGTADKANAQMDAWTATRPKIAP